MKRDFFSLLEMTKRISKTRKTILCIIYIYILQYQQTHKMMFLKCIMFTYEVLGEIGTTLDVFIVVPDR